MLHSLLHYSLLISVARTTNLTNPQYIIPIAVYITIYRAVFISYIGGYS